MEDCEQLSAAVVRILASSNDPESLIERAYKDSGIKNMATLEHDVNGGWFTDIVSAGGWKIQNNTVFYKYFRLITPKGINRIGRYHDDFCKFLESVIKIETQQSKKNNLLPHERRIIVIDDTKKLFVSTAIFYTVNEARKLFKFQAGHPISGTAYGMAEVLPNLYVVLCGFHDYFKQLKRDAFIGLCANLGAKEIAIEDYEENGKKIDVSVNGTLASMPVGGNIKGGYVQNKNTGKKIAYAFTEKNKLDPNYTSPWIETEPSWEKMRELRIKNHVESFDAEFNYTDEMGINANIAATFVQFGVGIGGSFSEMTKIKIKYHVDFWE